MSRFYRRLKNSTFSTGIRRLAHHIRPNAPSGDSLTSTSRRRSRTDVASSGYGSRREVTRRYLRDSSTSTQPRGPISSSHRRSSRSNTRRARSTTQDVMSHDYPSSTTTRTHRRPPSSSSSSSSSRAHRARSSRPPSPSGAVSSTRVTDHQRTSRPSSRQSRPASRTHRRRSRTDVSTTSTSRPSMSSSSRTSSHRRPSRDLPSRGRSRSDVVATSTRPSKIASTMISSTRRSRPSPSLSTPSSYVSYVDTTQLSSSSASSSSKWNDRDFSLPQSSSQRTTDVVPRSSHLRETKSFEPRTATPTIGLGHRRPSASNSNSATSVASSTLFRDRTSSSSSSSSSSGASSSSTYFPDVNSKTTLSSTPTPTTTSTPTTSLHGCKGLMNLGNTCYMNSALQALSNVSPLTQYFLSGRYSSDLNTRSSKTRGKLASEYARLLGSLWNSSESSNSSNDRYSSSSSSSYYSRSRLRDGYDSYSSSSRYGSNAVRPSGFKRMIERQSPMFCGYQQHDSQELLKYLLDGLHEDMNRIKRKPAFVELRDIPNETVEEKSDRYWNNFRERNDSVVSDLFCGQLKSELRCQRCQNASISFDPFFECSVPIPSRSRKKSRTFSFSFLTADSSSYTLADCLARFTESETLSGREKPNCAHCGQRTRQTKQMTFFRTPQVLLVLLKRFSATGRKLSNLIDFPVKNLSLLPYLDPSADEATKTNHRYNLIGVINHMGGSFGGHYTCYAKNTSSKKWMHYNDSSVRSVSSRNLQGSAAYVLVYLRKELYQRDYH